MRIAEAPGAGAARAPAVPRHRNHPRAAGKPSARRAAQHVTDRFLAMTDATIASGQLPGAGADRRGRCRRPRSGAGPPGEPTTSGPTSCWPTSSTSGPRRRGYGPTAMTALRDRRRPERGAVRVGGRAIPAGSATVLGRIEHGSHECRLRSSSSRRRAASDGVGPPRPVVCRHDLVLRLLEHDPRSLEREGHRAAHRHVVACRPRPPSGRRPRRGDGVEARVGPAAIQPRLRPASNSHCRVPGPDIGPPSRGP